MFPSSRTGTLLPMMDVLEKLATRWHSRWAEPSPDAWTAVAGLTPAVVITGGSAGIGLALADRFARRAKCVVVIARTESRLTTAATRLAASHPTRIEPLVLDLARPDAASVLIEWLSSRRLYCDVLVNNAGIGQSGPYATASPSDLDQLIAINVAAVARLTRSVLPGMLARAQGGILNVSSIGGLVPGPNQAAYYASKAFVLSLTEAIASEISGRGVRVAALLPGPVETRFHARMGAEDSLYRDILAAATPERVATAAIRGYRLGRRVIAPGLVPSLAVPLLRILPHSLTLPAVNWLLQKEPVTAKNPH